MLVYGTKRGGSVVVIAGQNVTAGEAIRKANKHFKVKLDRLSARRGYIYGDGLYWDKPGKKACEVWAVYKDSTEV